MRATCFNPAIGIGPTESSLPSPFVKACSPPPSELMFRVRCRIHLAEDIERILIGEGEIL
jgi:hypothetical protein